VGVASGRVWSVYGEVHVRGVLVVNRNLPPLQEKVYGYLWLSPASFKVVAFLLETTP
jgi:hypothetical protein